jgi:hypothetical protein
VGGSVGGLAGWSVGAGWRVCRSVGGGGGQSLVWAVGREARAGLGGRSCGRDMGMSSISFHRRTRIWDSQSVFYFVIALFSSTFD